MTRKEQLEAELKECKAAHDELAGRIEKADAGQAKRLFDRIDPPIRSALQKLVGNGQALPANLADDVLGMAVRAIYGEDAWDLIKKVQ